MGHKIGHAFLRAESERQVERDVTTIDELLTAIQSHLQPRARASLPTNCHAALQQLLPNGFPYNANEIIGEMLKLSDRF
jgi:hypothetical protein